MKRSLCKKTQRVTKSALNRFKGMKNHKLIKSDCQLHTSVSCPSLLHHKYDSVPKGLSPICVRRTCSVLLLNRQNLGLKSNFGAHATLLDCQKRGFNTGSYFTVPQNLLNNAVQTLGSVAGCPCPFPCGPCGCRGGCHCLPPPCNTPAKCVQYMTGYYYYPYGTWFCGPYHVSTGPCGPCAGPVRPGGPCGPCSPSPGGPCGPSCISPCGPCGPLVGCGVCGVNPPNSSQSQNILNTYDPWQSFNMNGTNPYMNYDQTQYYDQYGQYNTPNTFFGPCYDVHIPPTPVQAPMTCYNVPAIPAPAPMQNSPELSYSQTSNSSIPKSSISWPPIQQKENTQFTRTANLNSPTVSSVNNLQPQPTRISPPFPYNTKSNLSRTNPYTKPRFNQRTILPSNSVGACYFTTKCMQKYKSNKILNKHKGTNEELKNERVNQLGKEKKKILNWSIFDRE